MTQVRTIAELKAALIKRGRIFQISDGGRRIGFEVGQRVYHWFRADGDSIAFLHSHSLITGKLKTGPSQRAKALYSLQVRHIDVSAIR